MDLGGKPEGNDISGDDSVNSNGVHHDPLNENLEETWSALGEQDVPSAADSDPGMLPPPIPVLPTALGSIIGQPIDHRGMSELSIIQADDSSSVIAISTSRVNSAPHISEDSRQTRGPSQLQLEFEFTPSSHIQVGLLTSASLESFQKKEDVKSKDTLFSKSSPSLYQTCSHSSKHSSVIGNASLFCRICHEGGCNEQFISPCCCRGSLSRVHKTCLERWLAESDSSHCELCGFKYRTKRVPKYGLISSIFAWLTSTSTSRERRHLLIDILALLIISPIIGLSTILALQLADSLFILDPIEKMEQSEVRVLPRRGIEQDLSNKSHTLEMVGTMISRLGQMGIISMVITMDMAYISWVAMRLQSHVTKWYTWYRRNCKVTLIGYPEQVVAHTPARPPSSLTVHEISF